MIPSSNHLDVVASIAAKLEQELLPFSELSAIAKKIGCDDFIAFTSIISSTTLLGADQSNTASRLLAVISTYTNSDLSSRVTNVGKTGQ